MKLVEPIEHTPVSLRLRGYNQNRNPWQLSAYPGRSLYVLRKLTRQAGEDHHVEPIYIHPVTYDVSRDDATHAFAQGRCDGARFNLLHGLNHARHFHTAIEGFNS